MRPTIGARVTGRRLLISLALASLLAVAIPASALGFECINTSRSDQGNAGAAQSNGWVTLPLAELFAFAIFIVDNDLESEFGLPELPPRSPEQIPTMASLALAAGVPDGFLVNAHAVAAGGVHRNGDPSGVLSNGRGIDHFPDAYGEELIGAYLAAA